MAISGSGGKRFEEGGWSVHHLEQFVEKPDFETASEYLAEGGYLWNSGMFAWRATDLLAEIQRQLPLLFEGIGVIGDAIETPSDREVLEEVYPHLPRTSVDFGIMESARQCWTMPVDFGWSDVGSWPALAEVLAVDANGNTSRGRTIDLESRNNILVGDGVLIAAIGVNDLVVVATPDAVLVVPRSEAQKVKGVVEALRERGWDDVL